jgi:predicted DNA-binding transcriptional regulator AlpA
VSRPRGVASTAGATSRVDERNLPTGVSRSSTTVRAVQIDTDHLVDLAEAAALIGIDNPRGVSVYRRRYDDFPAPVIAKGRCVLWLRSDVEAWARATGRLP